MDKQTSSKLPHSKHIIERLSNVLLSEQIPTSVYLKYEQFLYFCSIFVAGHTLLERYGMTEIGMGLSNPLTGERRPVSIGGQETKHR